jgi:hypothetical protein
MFFIQIVEIGCSAFFAANASSYDFLKSDHEFATFFIMSSRAAADASSSAGGYALARERRLLTKSSTGTSCRPKFLSR